MSLAASRYAQALAELSVRDGTADRGPLLRQMRELYEQSPEFRAFMAHPRIKTADKKALLRQVCPPLADFLCLLLDKGRLSQLGGILDEYERLNDERNGVVTVKVLSAYPLEPAQLESIRGRYPGCRLETAVQPALLGGIKIVEGDRVTDATVAARLRALERCLVNTEVGCGNHEHTS